MLATCDGMRVAGGRSWQAVWGDDDRSHGVTPGTPKPGAHSRSRMGSAPLQPREAALTLYRDTGPWCPAARPRYSKTNDNFHQSTAVPDGLNRNQSVTARSGPMIHPSALRQHLHVKRSSVPVVTTVPIRPRGLLRMPALVK